MVERRADALTRERIVRAAVEILDAEGEAALTFRALTTRLATGAGAIYWHVANKGELLAAATADVIGRALAGVPVGSSPEDAIRAIALGLFEAIDTHPWVGGPLAIAPGESPVLEIFESVGGHLLALGVGEDAELFTASTIVGYILGAAHQNAANARNPAYSGDRAAFLDAHAARLASLDPATHPFLHRIAGQIRVHDDREQFLAGIDLILAGIAATGARLS